MIFPLELRGAERAMDGLAARFQATARNVANVHTPGYQRQVVEFEDTLAEAIAMAEVDVDPERPLEGPPPDNSEFLESWQPVTRPVERRAQRIDGNGVSLENEMAEVSRSALRFNLLSTWVASEYRSLKFVIDAR